MIVLIITDLHHGISTSQFIINQQLAGLNYISEIVKDRNVDLIVNCGDTYEKRENGDFMVIDVFKEIHRKLSNQCRYITTAGNHDCYFTNTNKITSLPVIFENSNVEMVIDDILKIDNMLFCPWINEENSSRLSEIVSDHNNDSNYLFGHFDFSGFRHGSILSKEDSLYKSDYWKYKMVISGHYHLCQKKDNIFYAGSLFQRNRGELEKKYFHLLDTETGKIESIEMPYRFYENVVIHDESDLDKIEMCHNRISTLHINSSNEELWTKVDLELEKYQPVRISITYRNSDNNEAEEIQDYSSLTNEELNVEYLERLEHDNEESREEFNKVFYEFWES